MKKIHEFFLNTIIGGVLVILPSAIFLFILTWILGLIRKVISPFTSILMVKSSLQGVVADILVIILFVMVCFFIGAVVRTRIGRWSYLFLESKLLLKIPGYALIKETVSSFFGKKKSPFSSVALAQIFGNETLVTAFITDESDDNTFTVFIPTGPNPTSGNIYHLQKKYVHPIDVSVEDAMRSIISCGAGSSKLMKKYKDSLSK